MTDYGPRHREHYEETFDACFVHHTRVKSLWPYDYISGPVSYRSSTDEVYMDDVVLENFPAKLASGEALPINPMMRRQVETKLTPAWVDKVYISDYGTHLSVGDVIVVDHAQGCSLELYDEGVETSVLESATLKAYAAVDSAEVQVLATIAELADTRAMLISAVRSIGKICKSVRNLNRTLREIEIYPENHRDLLTTAENTWMGIRMGWRPFVGECQSILNAITVAERPVWQTFRGTDSVSRSKSISRIVIPELRYSSDCTDTESQYITAKTTILCEQRAGGFPDTFGLTQIPSTLYNITPLSWAVDYFFNFGELISAKTPDALWRPLRVSGVVRTEHSIKSILGDYIEPASTLYSGGYSGGGATYKSSTCVRRSDPPRAGILTSVELNWQKFIDIAIVGRQQMSKAVKTLTRRANRSRSRRIRRMLNAQ